MIIKSDVNGIDKSKLFECTYFALSSHVREKKNPFIL